MELAEMEDTLEDFIENIQEFIIDKFNLFMDGRNPSSRPNVPIESQSSSQSESQPPSQSQSQPPRESETRFQSQSEYGPNKRFPLNLPEISHIRHWSDIPDDIIYNRTVENPDKELNTLINEVRIGYHNSNNFNDKYEETGDRRYLEEADNAADEFGEAQNKLRGYLNEQYGSNIDLDGYETNRDDDR